jgi:hypothetical protein
MSNLRQRENTIKQNIEQQKLASLLQSTNEKLDKLIELQQAQLNKPEKEPIQQIITVSKDVIQASSSEIKPKECVDFIPSIDITKMKSSDKEIVPTTRKRNLKDDLKKLQDIKDKNQEYEKGDKS